MKIETDRAEVTSGIRHGRTLGSPVALRIENRDYANWEERMNPWPVDGQVDEVHLPRPGHADLAGVQKFGFTDVRNVLERASARETAARVACGRAGEGVPARPRASRSAATSCGSGPSRRPAPERPRPDDFDGVDESPVRCLDAAASAAMVAEIDARPQGERVARRHLRGDRLRRGPGPRLARLLGGAPRRPPRAGDHVDPGDEGRGHRRRLRPRGAGRAPRPTTRSSGPRSRASSARRTAPAGSRAA